MKPENNPIMEIQKIRGQNLTCKHGIIDKNNPTRCNKKATYFIILGDDKLPACTRHTYEYIDLCEWAQWRRIAKKIGEQRWR